MRKRSVSEVVAIAAAGALVAFLFAYAIRSTLPKGSDRPRISTPAATFTLYPNTARVAISLADGTLLRELDTSIVVDGVEHPVVLRQDDAHKTKSESAMTIPAGTDSIDADLVIEKTAGDALRFSLRARAATLSTNHEVSLRVEMPTRQDIAFVSGVGELGDRGTAEGALLLVDTKPRPLGFVSPSGSLVATNNLEEGVLSDEPMRLSAVTPTKVLTSNANISAELALVVGESSMQIWKELHDVLGVRTASVHGKVTGTSDQATIFGRDKDGAPRIRARALPDGTFDLQAPLGVVDWYATIDASRASTLTHYVPGTSEPLTLDVSPGGELRVRVIDYDTKKPLTARLLVRGIEGTMDPSFGPDYRASGAGPIIDALRGDVATPLPRGKYRVAATRGLEWTVDAKNVEVTPGRTIDVELAPRHVVPTPYTVGCDLHVHARPSFDTPVSTEDRVLSLVSAGVDFAVPTEHNIVGDYSEAVQVLDLGQDLAWVSGVEVTTRSPAIGHFGVYPYPVTQKVPPFQGVSAGHIFAAARAGDPNRVITVHHPRLSHRIGYFDIAGFDPTQRPPRGMRLDFDAIEVYNGYDSETPERVEEVLRDYYSLLNLGYRYVATGSSDSHRIQFHWAGYPRTMVELTANDFAGDRTLDPLRVVAAIKKGHATVTSGPVIEFEVEGAHPGDAITTTQDPLPAHLRVRAAPWIDVTSADVIVGGQLVVRIPVESRPTEWGARPVSLDEASADTIRLDRDLLISAGAENTWILVIVRGTRRMDDVLPFMPVPPFAFSNPVYVVRKPAPLPSKTPQTEPSFRTKPR